MKNKIKVSKSEAVTILKNAAIELFIGKSPKPEMTEEEAKEKGYVNLRVPFVGYYDSAFTDSVNKEEEILQEEQVDLDEFDISVDGWLKSPGWKKFLESLESEEMKKKYLNEDVQLSLSIPVDQMEFINAGKCAIDNMIDNTLLKDIIHPLDWPYREVDSPDDYFYRNDELSLYVPREEIEKMMVPEVFKSKWYKTFAKYRTSPHSGYAPFPWHTYDRYFDREDTLCMEATILFWVAMGCYSDDHYIDPLTIEEAEKLEPDKFSDPFHDKYGLHVSMVNRLLDNYLNEKGFYPVNYKISQAL